MSLLQVRNLSIHLQTSQGEVQVVRQVSFDLARGASLGLIGESGCGKSITALALMGLLPDNARVSGSIRLAGRELLGLPERELCAIRGDRIGMIFQEPMTALNPVHCIGHQVAEPLRLHQGMSRAAAREQSIALLERVGIADAAQRFNAYPHQFSGGQRQRITIAMALACGPDLLIADEPTTALDVTLQKQILDLIRDLVQERGMALLLISHDLRVVAHNVNRVLVMYGGTVVESGTTETVFTQPTQAYTRGLIASRPQLLPASAHAVLNAVAPPPSGIPLLRVQDLVRHYPLARRSLLAPVPVQPALKGVSLTLHAGRNLGIVGESGSGKSTLARLVMALDKPTSGQVQFLGQNVHALPAQQLLEARQQFQMVFQDPYSSLDPRQAVWRIVAEPLAAAGHLATAKGRVSRPEQRERASAALHSVGLDSKDLDKLPHEFSGGQRQRIAIARALICRPQLIVADEPVSALDASVQAQVLRLMQDLAQEFGITYLFISHDLAVVGQMCADVAVMQAGRIVEQGPPQRLFSTPEHEYTRTLLAALPLL